MRRHRFFCGIVICFLSVFGLCGISKNLDNKKVFLCGKSLESAYLNNFASVENESDVIIEKLFDLAVQAQNRHIKSAEALNIIDLAVSDFFRRIESMSRSFRSDEVTVLIFGGIVQAGGDFLKDQIQQHCSKKLNQKKIIKIVFSKLGDERSILGAVIYAIYKLGLKDKSDYAVGIDIGGTSIRIGLVKLEDLSSMEAFIKEPVFFYKTDKERMKHLSSEIIFNARKLHYSSDFPITNLNCFIKDQELYKEHEVLSKELIEKICRLVKRVKKEYNIKFIAVSSAGDVVDDGFIQCAYNLPFTCVDLKNEIRRRLNCQVIVANDIFCAAVGEKFFGSLIGIDEFIIAGLGTDLGIRYFKSGSISKNIGFH